MTQVNGMSAVSGTPSTTDTAPQITTLPVLRSVDIPDGTLRIVQPEPRVIPTAPPVPLSARFHPDVYGPSDRIDGHHFEQAFGGTA